MNEWKMSFLNLIICINQMPGWYILISIFFKMHIENNNAPISRSAVTAVICRMPTDNVMINININNVVR